jgi:hypothetical protein
MCTGQAKFELISALFGSSRSDWQSDPYHARLRESMTALSAWLLTFGLLQNGMILTSERLIYDRITVSHIHLKLTEVPIFRHEVVYNSSVIKCTA